MKVKINLKNETLVIIESNFIRIDREKKHMMIGYKNNHQDRIEDNLDNIERITVDELVEYVNLG